MCCLYHTYRAYLKKRFGSPVLRIPVSAGFSCPNRDGKISRKGCSFCDNRSFSPVALNPDSAVLQLQNSIQKASSKFSHFIAYLQPFTNTYGTVEELRSVYEPLVNTSGVVGLAIGTRPDCLPEDVCNYLSEVSAKTYLSVEIGLQSCSDTTLRKNNRGHNVKDFETAVMKLAHRKIETVAHVIIGLPGDTKESALDTARMLSELPVMGIKIHQLMIIYGTETEKLFQNKKVSALTLEEYASIAGEFISLLRKDQLIHRIVADSKPEYGLIAPLWSAEKMKAISYIRKCMEEEGIYQGKNL